jgi:hypothetical protein
LTLLPFLQQTSSTAEGFALMSGITVLYTFAKPFRFTMFAPITISGKQHTAEPLHKRFYQFSMENDGQSSASKRIQRQYVNWMYDSTVLSNSASRYVFFSFNPDMGQNLP